MNRNLSNDNWKSGKHAYGAATKISALKTSSFSSSISAPKHKLNLFYIAEKYLSKCRPWSLV